MADKSAIEWTDATWNPTVGCSIVSPGCTNCYAMNVAHSLRQRFNSTKYAGLTKIVSGNAVWTGEVRLDEGALLQPLKWKKSRRIFVNSMSDLFHENLTDEQIDRVFAVMALCPQHAFQVLTKRAERMLDYLAVIDNEPVRDTVRRIVAAWPGDAPTPSEITFPLPNVWLGVSCERQQEANERIPLLLQTPAAVRFISAEPLLGPIDLNAAALATRLKLASLWPPPSIDWVIVGGESGKDARPFHIEWGDSLIAQCKAAGVACFVKQLGACAMSDGYPVHLPTDRKGGDWSQWPDRLRVREFPDAARSAGTLTEPVEPACNPLS